MAHVHPIRIQKKIIIGPTIAWTYGGGTRSEKKIYVTKNEKGATGNEEEMAFVYSCRKLAPPSIASEV